MKSILLILILFFALTSCEVVMTKMPERTYSISEAKKKKVFIAEYIPSNQTVFFNDSVSFEFKEIWAEYPWWYINQQKDIEIRDNVKGKILYRFKDETDYSLHKKGVNIWSKDVPYSGFNNIYFELNNIDYRNDNKLILLNIALYDSNRIKLDSTSIELIKKEP